ncbi:hypothetical protein J1D01_09610 [Seonamhaeicola sp. NFXS20]|uniref:hypothetical protein n=1 Tax=Seonamhaeicola sp. NFXS20 TaxID=2816959 RepID=UPI003B8B6C34
MFKHYIVFLLITFSIGSLAQTNLSTSGLGGSSKESVSMFSGLKAKEYHTNFNNNGNIEGTPYLFKSWKNKSKIWYEDKIFNLDSVNYNIRRDTFVFRLKNDSIFILNPKKITKVEINNFVSKYTFKPYPNNKLEENSFYEVLYDNKNYSLLSKYKLKVKGGSVDPLTKEYITPRQYVPEKDYFILKHNEGETITDLKLKKTVVLKLIESPYLGEVKRFVKKQRLKYTQIADVNRILTYYYSIKR